MQNLLRYRGGRRRGVDGSGVIRRWVFCLLAVACFAVLSTSGAKAQSTGDTTPNALDLGPRCPTCPIVIASGSLSAKDKADRADRANQNAQKKNFSVANATRKQYIDDETKKMLILVRDLKAKIDGMGAERPSAIMLREAAVIEFLAKDIKEKMKLTINPD